MRRLLSTAAVLGVALVCSGHVGTLDAWYDGHAGPYPVRVIVRVPGVVPGLADVSIRVHGGAAERVLVAPALWNTGDEGVPAPDLAVPVRGDPELHSAQLWLMARGAYRIIVTVEGPQGSGTAVVPVVAQSTQRLPMSRAAGAGLAGAGIFLFVGLLTLVGAAVRESVLPPGVEPGRERRRRARQAMGFTAVAATLLLFGGWRWWSAVDEAHRARMDRPWASEARARVAPDGGRVLEFSITDSLWVRRNDPAMTARFGRPLRTPLIPDHGKLMHMFLVREPDLGAFAHLHPVSRDSVRFDVALPPLPAGRYTVYAAIVQESGTTHTLVTEIELPAAGAAAPDGGAAAPHDPPAAPDDAAPALYEAAPAPAPDPDDAWWAGASFVSLTARDYPLGDGLAMRWRSPAPVVAGREVELRVELVDREGGPALIEPYMGMMGHAMIRRDDGAVFVHLHPSGTVSVAAQRAMALRQPEDSVYGLLARRLAAGEDPQAGEDPHRMHGAAGAHEVVFPYAFPRPGRYRVWVQLLHEGRVRTGAWDVDVEPAAR